MRLSASLPTGVAALFFESARKRRQLENQIVDQLEKDGFGEVILPVVDYLEPYEAMPRSIRTSDLYRFVDRDGEVLALRSDFTPMVARLIVPRLASYELPLKLFYRGDVLRYQEERAGRQREFYQLGGEVLSRDGGICSRTALRQLLEILRRTLGGDRPTQLLVVLGFAGALDEVLIDNDDPRAVLEGIVRRERSLARHAPVLREVVENGVPDDPAALGETAADRLVELQALAEETRELFPEIDLRVDLAEFADQVLAPRLRRTLSIRPYYDGLIFRAFAGRSAEPVGGGGRYDRLFQSLGVEDVHAAGFTVSLDRVIAHRGEERMGEEA